MRCLFILFAALSLPLVTFGQCCRTSAAVYQQQVYAVPVAQQVCTYAPVQQQVQTYAAPAVATVPVCTYASVAQAAPVYQSYTTAAAYAMPTYYSQSFAAPVYRTTQAFAVNQSYGYGGAAAINHGPAFLGPPIVRGYGGGVGLSPGGFRAGFAGQGLNNAGGAGFLTGGGLIGGAANLLGVSSAGLEGAALGVLATRSNLFGLAPRRR